MGGSSIVEYFLACVGPELYDNKNSFILIKMLSY